MSEEGPRCPRCGRHLSYLKRICTETVVYELSADGCYDSAESREADCKAFVCPYCGYEIAHDETEAIEFLRKRE